MKTTYEVTGAHGTRLTFELQPDSDGIEVAMTLPPYGLYLNSAQALFLAKGLRRLAAELSCHDDEEMFMDPEDPQ